jgi:hypothetical protein
MENITDIHRRGCSRKTSAPTIKTKGKDNNNGGEIRMGGIIKTPNSA